MNQPVVRVRNRKKKTWTKILLVFISCVLLLIGSGFVYEYVAAQQAKKNYAPPGKLVDVGGFRLHVDKIGSGSPVILLEAGSRESSLIWRDIPEKLAEFATVVRYDRAGYAWSDPARTERSGDNIVQELHSALEQEGIRGPYILVGHSAGGMYSRLFAEKYKDEVEGLVLLDARPENYSRETDPIFENEGFDSATAGMPSKSVIKLLKMSGSLRIFQNSLFAQMPEKERTLFVNVEASSSFLDTAEEEDQQLAKVEEAIRNQHLDSLPVKIITHGIPNDATAFGMSAEASKKLEDIWQAQQRDMLRLSTDSELIVAERSGHMVMHDEPDLVLDAIKSVIQNRTRQGS